MTIKVKIKGFVFFPEYFSKLLGCVHKWIGENNDEHGNLSLYSFSHIWNDHFYFSSFSPELCERIVIGITKSPHMWDNVSVCDYSPVYFDTEKNVLKTASPIFAKIENRHVFDKEAEKIIESILIKKANFINLQLPNFSVSLSHKRNKLIKIHDICNRCAHYEVFINDSFVYNFALAVGLGNCTGVGFGHVVPKNEF